ncbi:MAG TPA: transglutaminase family protein [Leptolyngbyaceae cyanobacterium]
MKFNLGSLLHYTVLAPTTIVFNLQIIENQYQNICQEKLHFNPHFQFDEYTAIESNGTRYVRINAPAGKLEVYYEAAVELYPFYCDPNEISEIPPSDLPMETLRYLYPSRYCQSDRLFGLVQSEFSHLYPGYSRVTAICNWIYEKVTYLSGSSDSQTSAYDTAMERKGVCRDFAHLGIALCRALNIPARFVSTYAYKLNPPDFHACFEAYLGDRWYLFDPTRLVPLDGLVRIGTGRDAADVSFATFFGSVQLEQMKIFVERLSEETRERQENDGNQEMAIAIA